MGEQPEEQASDLFDDVETVVDLESSDGGIELTPEDRPRGILSPTDREYLCGLKEYAQPQSDANRRQDIRKRVQNGLKDFVLLSLLLEGDEREKVFDELGEKWTEDVLTSMMAFAYLGLGEDRPRFESMIAKGVLQAENLDMPFESAGRATEADVSISVEYNPDVDKLYRRFREGNELTDAEIGTLVREGRLDNEDITQLEKSTKDVRGIFAGSRLD